MSLVDILWKCPKMKKQYSYMKDEIEEATDLDRFFKLIVCIVRSNDDLSLSVLHEFAILVNANEIILQAILKFM